MGIGIYYYLQTILHGHENGDVARGWSQNKRQNGLSIKKGLYIHSWILEILLFFSLLKIIVYLHIYINKLNENKIQELTQNIKITYMKGGPKRALAEKIQK